MTNSDNLKEQAATPTVRELMDFEANATHYLHYHDKEGRTTPEVAVMRMPFEYLAKRVNALVDEKDARLEAMEKELAELRQVNKVAHELFASESDKLGASLLSLTEENRVMRQVVEAARNLDEMDMGNHYQIGLVSHDRLMSAIENLDALTHLDSIGGKS